MLKKNITKFFFFQTKVNINFRWSIKFCTNISKISKNNTFSLNISSLDHNQTHYYINEISSSNRLSPATCITIYLNVVTRSFLLFFILLLIVLSVLCFVIFRELTHFHLSFTPLQMYIYNNSTSWFVIIYIYIYIHLNLTSSYLV